MSERLVAMLRRGWPRCFAVAVGALVVAALATVLGMGSIARCAGTIAWTAALVGTVLGLSFHARFDDEVEW